MKCKCNVEFGVSKCGDPLCPEIHYCPVHEIGPKAVELLRKVMSAKELWLPDYVVAPKEYEGEMKALTAMYQQIKALLDKIGAEDDK